SGNFDEPDTETSLLRQLLPGIRVSGSQGQPQTGWMTSTYGVFLGLDVGKGEHHAVGLDPAGKRLHDGPLPNSEPKLRAVFDKLAQHGPLLVVVDQPATIGALPVAVARACGHQVAYLPGLAMRRIADLYPGNAKTDARDAFVIADAARTLPHTLRQVGVGDDALAELGVLAGFDDDLAAEATRISNRIRGLLTGIHPALERALGPRVAHTAALELLVRCGGPIGLGNTSRRKLISIATKHAPRMGERLIDELLAALSEQTVVVPGAAAADMVLPRLAESLRTVLEQRKALASEIEGILDAHPLAEVLATMVWQVRSPPAEVRSVARNAAAYSRWAPVSAMSLRPRPPRKLRRPGRGRVDRGG
ncbi:Transposase, partial [Saccharopolyspora shandongensis]